MHIQIYWHTLLWGVLKLVPSVVPPQVRRSGPLQVQLASAYFPHTNYIHFKMHSWTNLLTHIIMGGSKTSAICCSTPSKEKWATASSNGQCFSSTYELRFITKWVSSSPLIHFLLYAQHASVCLKWRVKVVKPLQDLA